MKQYLDLCQRIVDEGTWIENERTGKRCLTVINADLTYDVANNQFPLVTTRKSFWKAAVAELLGYIRGYDNAEDFRKLGTKTWDANANLNEAWLNNPYRKGEDDMAECMAYKAELGQNRMAATLTSCARLSMILPVAWMTVARF
ncbi:thymidylate synthase [Vibrio astriarenae]|nr:thymidylate synthase [Vibrio sp. C7]